MVITGVYTLGCGTSGNIESAEDNQVTEAETDTTAETNSDEAEDKIAAEQREKFEEEYRKELIDRYQGKANGITTFYASAQRFFYMGRYQSALYHINKAAEIKETADVLALRGSIYLGLGNREKFTEEWRLALQMDNEVPIPDVPYLISQLKQEGLISQNYKPGN
ncbi:MAG: hypothetical protein RI564_09070 [Gracilimonas sp.]|nr:hypothetical protein [Gracilimonas sp.]